MIVGGSDMAQHRLSRVFNWPNTRLLSETTQRKKFIAGEMHFDDGAGRTIGCALLCQVPVPAVRIHKFSFLIID